MTAYSNWAGADTTEDPDRVTMASLNDDTKGTAAFETLFHEVLHTMDRPLFERFRGPRAPGEADAAEPDASVHLLHGGRSVAAPVA